MQQLLFTQLHLDELRTVISDVVKTELKNELQGLTPTAQPTDLLTRKETASILGISLPTLHEWTKDSKIPAYRIGTRIRYKRIEVEQSLNQIKGVKKEGYNG